MTDHTKVSATIRICKNCGKGFPLGIDKCPDDGGELMLPGRNNLIGTVFEKKYAVLSILGQGGMSIVYKARHVHMEKIRALKLLNEELTKDDVAKERFRREASAASSLSHQNVVVVHDFGFTETEPEQAYLVMDCLEGISLADIVESQGVVSLPRAIEIFKQGLDGLEHAHKKGIIHRDIKPSNLVVIAEDDGSDLVKLVDFGIAKAAPQQGERQLQQLTQTGEIFGSPLYMSPEQCNGRAMDARSDIYSFGCLMYETLAGVPPLIGDTYINTVVKHLQESPPPFSKTAPHTQIPQAVEAVIMKCLEKDPDKRYSSVAEVRQALLDAALAAGIKGYRAGAVPEVPRRSPLAQTFERVKLAATGSLPKDKHQKRSLMMKLGISIGCIVAAVVGMNVPYGVPKVDNLSAWERIVYPQKLGQMTAALEKGNLAEAQKLGKEAEAMATRFDDSGDRLEKTLRAEWRVAAAANDVAEQERLREAIGKLVTSNIRREYLVVHDHLSKLEVPVNSDSERLARQKEVQAIGTAARDNAIRLHSRDKHQDEELELQQAIRVYELAGLTADPRVADFKTNLAKCYAEQQRYQEAAPLYSDAVDIRRTAQRDLSDIIQLSRALLTLGSFERDQSKFKSAADHLRESIQIARLKAKDDQLLLDNLKAYLDLLKQASDTKVDVQAAPGEADKVSQEITALQKKIGRSPSSFNKDNPGDL